MRKAYGGVVINSKGLVLLREPADHYKGDVWTFAKGRPFPGESPEQTALCEVLEETGYLAEIAAKIPGSFEGKRTSNEYFLMLPIEETQQFDEETQSIRWANPAEARQLIQLNRKPNRRRRDLRVLKLAVGLFASLQRIYASPGPNAAQGLKIRPMSLDLPFTLPPSVSLPSPSRLARWRKTWPTLGS
jgi:8-oxo-dGTP pyrophosphatase MutT (NUDIX family)